MIKAFAKQRTINVFWNNLPKNLIEDALREYSKDCSDVRRMMRFLQLAEKLSKQSKRDTAQKNTTSDICKNESANQMKRMNLRFVCYIFEEITFQKSNKIYSKKPTWL